MAIHTLILRENKFPIIEDPLFKKACHMRRRCASHANGLDGWMFAVILFHLWFFEILVNQKRNSLDPFFDRNNRFRNEMGECEEHVGEILSEMIQEW
jgi:hypothetical protein